ncbi:hypothetical protein [Ramlibacter rhizophilus]|uniref:Uncharacterized protein n=1 Tax=Ramlibacter rhizophilus TaxID=1781167 RepID=A0A4Z0BQ20_9BURK|nr:hypothetical protein [Ramlibacter rhizophilus]TFZ01387.1 hypothetical protein EZ242_08395 [Ramlibacter rhizophilus]
MFARISAYFSGTRPSATSAPPPISAAKVKELCHLQPLLAGAKLADSTQVRVSWGQWKLKPGGGSSSSSALRHQKAAIDRNQAMFTIAFADRQCASLAQPLLAKIRGDQRQLSVGHLRNELLALQLVDVVKSTGLRGNQVTELLLHVFDQPVKAGPDLTKAVEYAARQMQGARSLAADNAWLAAQASFPAHCAVGSSAEPKR